MPKTKRFWTLYDSLHKLQSNAVSTEDAQLAILKMSERDTNRFYIWTDGWEKWQLLKAYLESNQKIFISSFPAPAASEDTVFENEITVKALARDVLEMKPVGKLLEDEITKSLTSSTLTSAKLFSKISLQEVDIMQKDEKNLYAYKFDGDDLSMNDIKKPNGVDFKTINPKSALKTRDDRHDLKIEILMMSQKGKTFRSRSLNISMSGTLLEDSIPSEFFSKTFDIVVINLQPCDPKLHRVSLKAKTVGESLTQRIHYINMTPQSKKNLQDLLENYLMLQEKIEKAS